ncbi:MAG: hypothetical protein ABII64_08015, partial [Elusimicrobiota bacterium]
YRDQLSDLNEKLNDAERVLTAKNEEFASLLAQKEGMWKDRERMIAEEKNRLTEALAAFKAEASSLQREKEKLINEKHQAEERMRTEMLNTERRLFEEKENFQQILMDKEQEMSQIRSARQSFETDVKQDLENRYRKEIDRLQKEKDDASWKLSRELEQLRGNMNQELRSLEDQVEGERQSWKKKIETKGAEHEEAVKQLKELRQQLSSEHTSREQNFVKLREEAELRISEDEKRFEEEKQKLIARIRYFEDASRKTAENEMKLNEKAAWLENMLSLEVKEVEKLKAELLSAAAEERADVAAEPPVEKADAGSTVVIEPRVPEASDIGILRRFWRMLNEPVIEIDKKEKLN